MNIALKRRAVRHFNSPVLTQEQNKNMRRKWLRCIAMLGAKWVLHPSNPKAKEFAS